MTRKLALAALGLVLAGTANAQAPGPGAQGPDPIVTRQAGQDLMAGDFTGIRMVVMLKGDVTKLEQPAKAMARWMQQFPALFPQGSDKGHDTKALPAVWSDSAGFRKDSDNFVEAADKLAELAKAGNLEAVAGQVKVVGETCGACHRTYRAR